MDGVLLIDKPSGPTSHDVVAAIRRSSGEKRIGHTGTLDPRATGLLPLVMGRATRLASRITGGLKTYEAQIQLGHDTDTDDADGHPVGPIVDAHPSQTDVDEALDAFRGTFDQVPPQHSAKKVGGEKAYDLARRDQAVALAPVSVNVLELECLRLQGSLLSIRVTSTAGFYVRSLARDLGRRMGCGGHLAELRRTRSGGFDVADALPLGDAVNLGPAVATRLIAPALALPDLPAVSVNERGLTRAQHGNALGPDLLAQGWLPPPGAGEVRVLGPDGQLVALAHSRGGALHPVVVLG